MRPAGTPRKLITAPTTRMIQACAGSALAGAESKEHDNPLPQSDTAPDRRGVADDQGEDIPVCIATLVFLLSALAGGLFGFTAMLPYIAVLALAVIAGFIRARQLFQSHLGRARRRRPAVPGGNNRALFLHRLWCRVPRDTSVRRHARPIRRDFAARGLGAELRYLRARLPGRCRGDHFPAPEHLATVTSLGGVGPRFAWRFLRQGGARRNRRRITRTRRRTSRSPPKASPPKRSKLPVPAQLRQQLGMAHVDRAVFEIAGGILEILRHSVQHLGHVRLVCIRPANRRACPACSR